MPSSRWRWPSPRSRPVVAKYGGSSLATPAHIMRIADHIAAQRRDGRAARRRRLGHGRHHRRPDRAGRPDHRPTRRARARPPDGHRRARQRGAAGHGAARPRRRRDQPQRPAGRHSDRRHLRPRAHHRCRARRASVRSWPTAASSSSQASRALPATRWRRWAAVGRTRVPSRWRSRSTRTAATSTRTSTASTRADPRLVPDARRMPVLGYEEMLELAHQGAKVLQTRSVELAWVHGLEVRVRHPQSPDEGTSIREVPMEARQKVRAHRHRRRHGQADAARSRRPTGHGRGRLRAARGGGHPGRRDHPERRPRPRDRPLVHRRLGRPSRRGTTPARPPARAARPRPRRFVGAGQGEHRRLGHPQRADLSGADVLRARRQRASTSR